MLRHIDIVHSTSSYDSHEYLLTWYEMFVEKSVWSKGLWHKQIWSFIRALQKCSLASFHHGDWASVDHDPKIKYMVKSMWTTKHYYHHITCNYETNLKLFRNKNWVVHTVSAFFSLFLPDSTSSSMLPSVNHYYTYQTWLFHLFCQKTKTKKKPIAAI